MSKPTSKVKDRYNRKAYDTIMLRVYKGGKEVVKARAEEKGLSVNGYINKLIEEDI